MFPQRPGRGECSGVDPRACSHLFAHNDSTGVSNDRKFFFRGQDLEVNRLGFVKVGDRIRTLAGAGQVDRLKLGRWGVTTVDWSEVPGEDHMRMRMRCGQGVAMVKGSR